MRTKLPVVITLKWLTTAIWSREISRGTLPPQTNKKQVQKKALRNECSETSLWAIPWRFREQLYSFYILNLPNRFFARFFRRILYLIRVGHSNYYFLSHTQRVDHIARTLQVYNRFARFARDTINIHITKLMRCNILFSDRRINEYSKNHSKCILWQ